MRICDDGVYRDATPEEESEYNKLMQLEEAKNISGNSETALSNFFEGLSKSETNTIAKIRDLAKTFLQESEE